MMMMMMLVNSIAVVGRRGEGQKHLVNNLYQEGDGPAKARRSTR
jgi:hypothetical protein